MRFPVASDTRRFSSEVHVWTRDFLPYCPKQNAEKPVRGAEKFLKIYFRATVSVEIAGRVALAARGTVYRPHTLHGEKFDVIHIYDGHAPNKVLRNEQARTIPDEDELENGITR